MDRLTARLGQVRRFVTQSLKHNSSFCVSHTKFLWHLASHVPSPHMLAKGTLAYQRENDPGHQNGAKGRGKERENKAKFKFIQVSSTAPFNTFYVKAIKIQVNNVVQLMNLGPPKKHFS